MAHVLKNRYLPSIVVCLSLAVVPILYLPILDDPFYNDDINLLHTGRGFTHELLNPFFRPGFYRPVWEFYFFASYSLFGLNPLFYHLLSVALHIICSFLGYLLALRIMKTPLRASFVCLLFAISSKVTNAVHWISAVSSLLVGIFAISAILLFLHYLTHRQMHTLVLSCAVFALALLTKEEAITIIPLLWISEIFCHRKSESLKDLFVVKGRWKPYVPFLIIALAYTIIYFIRILEHPLVSGEHYAINAFTLFKFYEFAGEVFFNSTLWHAAILLSLIAIYTLVRGNREWKLGVFWFSIAILPFIPMQWTGVAERYNYIPVFGFCVFFFAMFGGFFDFLKNRRRRWIAILPVILVTAYLVGAIVSVRRDISDFGNDCTFFFNELEEIESSVAEIEEEDQITVNTEIHTPYVEQYIELRRGLRNIEVTNLKD